MNRIEQDIQKSCIRWFDYQYPQLKKLLHANYNNAKNRTQGGINQGMGVRSGVSDLEFFYQEKTYFLECKAPGNTQSDEQKEFERQILSQGGFYRVFFSIEEFITIINQIIKNGK